MLNRLSIKLFFTILLVNVLISAVIYLSVSRSIDNGFLNYVKHGQKHQIGNIVQTLEENWREHQSWEWLNEHGSWAQVLRDSIGGRHGNIFDVSSPPDSSTPFIPPLSDPRQFVLFDAHGKRVQGRPNPPKDLLREPIVVDGHEVGELGYWSPDRFSSTLDVIFLDNQMDNLAIILLALLPASLLLAAGIALWLGRRARLMAMATQSLTMGDFRVRLPTGAQDELSRFSSDINTLARTLEHNRVARQRWGADIAHELRTPLAILRGELEAMQDGVRPLTPSNIGSLSREVEVLSRLVDDLRLLAETDNRQIDAQLEELNLSEMLARQIEDRRGAADNLGFTLEAEITDGVLIEGAPYRLHQLWRNLLDNSIAYTDAPGTIKVTLTRNKQHAVIVWEDSSPGVPDKYLGRLTERLFRVDASRNRQSGGSGLGLAIVQALVAMHKGTMQAQSSSLGGLRWVIHIPLLRQQVASAASKKKDVR
ncbi:ATP-binding protein [Carnimonas nigrificans]|uniref:ATP-binding protein n=1 Tax=Carnimonas nigrificans TaxID=64323 RepID=UPI000470E49F|nr:ATP-binding protein [Carnimonas nigrificans]